MVVTIDTSSDGTEFRPLPSILETSERLKIVIQAFPSQHLQSGFPSTHMCIGARDKILDHFFSRNSAPTTLDSLVPIGSPFLLIRTQALSSNLTKLPSGLRCSFRARTTTACLMSPLRTLFEIPKLVPPGLSGPKLLCFCTTTMIRSPRVPRVRTTLAAYLDREWELVPMFAALVFFLMTATHSTMAAPELSMQLSIVCCGGPMLAYGELLCLG